MKNICLTILFATISYPAFTQLNSVSMQRISNYKQWGWEAVVMQNGLITSAIVPVIGGRVMQFDLDSIPSIFINPSMLGKTYIPANDNYYRNFGGFKNWPAPQSQWNTSGWPPPPTLDYGNYTVKDSSSTADSVSLSISSPVEQWLAPGIRFERRATLYRGSSRVKMDQTMINEKKISCTWSMWDNTKSIVYHPGKTDYQNFWAYFPINPSSVYGTSGVYFPKSSTAWKGKIKGNVYGVQFVPDNKKIFADPSSGWIAYASISDSTVFLKTFDIFEGEQYPDNGARIALYVNGNPAYIEVEVTGPMVTLADSGASYTFTENWWAARVRSPIADANTTGIIAERISYNNNTQMFSAVYGVFYEGTAKLTVLDSADMVIAQRQLQNVTPLQEFQLQEVIAIPENSKVIEVSIYNSAGEFVGILERSEISNAVSVQAASNTSSPSEFSLSQNYPNPFNPSTNIEFQIANRGFVSLKIFDLLGREVATIFSEELPAGSYSEQWNAENLSSGIYYYRLQAGTYIETKKMILLR